MRDLKGLWWAARFHLNRGDTVGAIPDGDQITHQMVLTCRHPKGSWSYCTGGYRYCLRCLRVRVRC